MPQVSIGLPVYNGESYLVEALNSILGQSFEDFELIISDNASTDGTQEICRDFMSRDRRIRYYRQDENLGSARNFNCVFELSSAKYFKWAAHDDVLAPDYLEKCVEVLDRDASLVLCYPRARVIDENGAVLEDYNVKLKTDSPSPQERFYDLINVNHWCYQVFGLIRADVLRKTSLIGSYAASDRVLLAELALFGRFFEIPERLFFPRRHPKQYTLAHTDRYSQTAWFDKAKQGRIILPKWSIGLGYMAPLRRARLSGKERARCYMHVARWFMHNRRALAADLTAAGKQFLRRSKAINRMVVAAKRLRSVSMD